MDAEIEAPGPGVIPKAVAAYIVAIGRVTGAA